MVQQPSGIPDSRQAPPSSAQPFSGPSYQKNLRPEPSDTMPPLISSYQATEAGPNSAFPPPTVRANGSVMGCCGTPGQFS